MRTMMKQTPRLLQQIAVYLIVIALVLPTNSALQAIDMVSVIQPALLQLAKEEPTLAVRLIVQKSVANNQVEQSVKQLGGQIIRQSKHHQRIHS